MSDLFFTFLLKEGNQIVSKSRQVPFNVVSAQIFFLFYSVMKCITSKTAHKGVFSFT